ncbi:MAG: Ectoine hydroxylase-related dioxygenase, phytanoyl-CoA dioxygenase (PhyH) family [Chloroflexi bacterium AL-W]|nr:Ectoine hydroxylase-related dioxygenase, phytanoyl-CoA dioxygenase (PhyH) family [Chloroflexi bacterium AL-N1]NOK65210.1 Ectoine hydroxylase-related dioxygenase, phytanoyl-CoA dioxygenase (PhyH) family [Chloroflexi bacterium AL-N10]NOK72525.1 Ectoine hydroxylase-related dioxygenase, phytanoyl-CoA dioxygenase (PhyH) family [Chloroflexi bacterium AL-N5]NOK79389.1 Ectoine hydroxylase-related dioxygenase, phytanoyl-CoA dioxygenase (PhyH) family [Chloroflexi bacterium AL-W]NOK87305.1 Ectoine hydr
MKPTDREIYLFDLRGYLVLKQALSPEEVAACNAGIDAILPIAEEEWVGYVHGHSFQDNDGINLQQIYEGGPAFEQLIDHPSWIEKVKHLVGGEGTFDWEHGPLFIDENFANIRGPGEGIGLHSGGEIGLKRTQYRYHNGRFQCGQINILMVLTDIGPGDGATMVVPGSHKANFPHPDYDKHRMRGAEASVDGVEGAIEIPMKAGDALLFVDCLSHGSAKRVNEGKRRIIVYRYGPSWGNFRHGYQVSQELLERLTPARRQIVHPQKMIYRDPQKVRQV